MMCWRRWGKTMNKPVDLQQVLTQFLPTYAAHQRVDGRRRQVLSRLTQCRTAALGGFALHCAGCDERRVLYHACRVGHCPKCQQRASRQWSARQAASLLPVPYFHLVFTLPHTLNGWVQVHEAELYQVLFQAVWTTLNTFARDARRGLHGQLGMTAVMHTWSQTLTRHVHLHCLVPGGVLQADGRWRAARGTYLFPVKALSRHFRGTVVRALRHAATQGKLRRVTREGEVDAVLTALMASEWVVYAKPCVSYTPAVVDYLARYTHRIAISDPRIAAVDDHTVRFSYRDSRNENAPRVMSLEGEEFIRRYLQHILPKGLMRIRHYGFLANRCRRHALTQIRNALQAPIQDVEPAVSPPFTGLPCSHCIGGWLKIVTELAPRRDLGSGRLAMR